MCPHYEAHLIILSCSTALHSCLNHLSCLRAARYPSRYCIVGILNKTQRTMNYKMQTDVTEEITRRHVAT